MLVLIVVSVLASSLVALADDPQPCTSPAQWESRYIEYNDRLGFYLNGNLSYDATNQRQRIVYFVDVLSWEARYDSIYLFNENVKYVYSLTSQKCYKRPLKYAWKDLGVPKEAKFGRQSYLGAPSIPNENLLTNVWYGPITDRHGRNIYYSGRFTPTSCLPVQIFYMSKLLGTTALNFIDISPGIANDQVFVPRPECLNNPAAQVDKADADIEKYL
jgi:hypothetical protein